MNIANIMGDEPVSDHPLEVRVQELDAIAASWARENAALAIRLIRVEATVARLETENAKLRRYPFEPICLNCGALEPCMTEADLKPDDPGIPCMFDPTPRQLFDENARLRDYIRVLETTLEAGQGRQ